MAALLGVDQDKMDKGKVKSYAEVVKDVKTMVGNAKTYNEPESDVFRDANVLNVRAAWAARRREGVASVC